MTLAEKNRFKMLDEKDDSFVSIEDQLRALKKSDDILTTYTNGRLLISMFTDGSLLTLNTSANGLQQGVMPVNTLIRIMAAYYPFEDVLNKQKQH